MLSWNLPDSLLPGATLALLLLSLACGPSAPPAGGGEGADFGSGITLSHVTPFTEILSDPEAFADS